jgi:outer membrane protein OmpA-like peptidoglycan-associated protein
MYARVLKSVSRVLALALVALIPVALCAQATATSTGKPFPNDSPSRWDIFAGYSYLAPRGTVTTTIPSGASVSANYDAVNLGGLFSGAYFFNKNIGAQVEFGLHEWGVSNGYPNNVGTHGNDDGFLTFAGGLIARFPNGNVTPFVHGLVGIAQVNGPYFQPNKWGPGLTVGGGMDYETPFLDHRLAIRLFQADYEYMHADFGPGVLGGRANINAARLSTGVVFHVGSIEPPPPATLACSASPASVFPGDPVTVTATAGSLLPKMNVIYSWSGSGATGNGTTAAVNTGSLDPGTYTVKGDVKEGKAGKEGLKPGQAADCTASFTVKAFEPPTLSCSATPSTINPGETSTVTSAGMSPQNRPLTYGYSAASGTISGTGTTATFNSTGAAPGGVPITCNVMDDKGHSATASTTVTITAPPPVVTEPSPEIKQLEARLALHSVFFQTDLPRVNNPDGGLVASQQGTLTVLATDFKKYLELKPGAHLTLNGHADSRGSADYNQALSERRVARTKKFLVEQGVPEASIETLGLGKEQGLTADQVKELVEQNPDLSATEREKVLHRLAVIVLAQNRRVDVVLSTTGQQSVRLYPFNAADSLTLLDEKAPPRSKKAAGKKVK